jgi:hypothetical protein
MSTVLETLGSQESISRRSRVHPRLKSETSAVPACLAPLFVPVLLLLGLLYHCFIACSHCCTSPQRTEQTNSH